MNVPFGIREHSNPGKLIFGENALSRIPAELGSFGKVLVLTDQGVKKAGILGKLIDVLEGASVGYEIFDEVPGDPPIETVESAYRVYRESECSSVLGLGGGSCLDASKAVAAVASTGEPISSYRDGRFVTGELIPVIAVPTTAGTGSEVTGVTVISDVENKIKLAIKGKPLVPKVVVLDPSLLLGIPPRIAAATGADALVHALEAYFSTNSNVVTDGLALQAIRLISGNLRPFVQDTTNLQHAYSMLMGSTIAGLAFSNAGLGLVHSLAHPVGAYYHVHHGLVCAMYLLPVLEFNMQVCLDKFVALANVLEGGAGSDQQSSAIFVLNFISDLFEKINIPRKAKDLGIEHFLVYDKMVMDAFAASPTKVNPRKATEEDIKDLFSRIV